MQFWQWLMTPHPRLVAEDERRRAQLLLQLLTLLIPGVLIADTMYQIMLHGMSEFWKVSLWFSVLIVGFLIGDFLLCRAGYFRASAVTFMVIVNLGIIITPLIGEPRNLNLLVYFVLPILFNFVFFNQRLALLNLAFAWVVGIGMGLYVEEYGVWRVINEPLIYILIITIIQVVAFHYQADLLKRKNSQVAASEERYRQLVELSPESILVYGEDGVLFANHAAYRMFQAEESQDIIGIPVENLIAGTDTAATVRVALQKRLSSDLIRQGEETLVTLKDGRQLPFEITSAPITYQGQPARLVISRDISSRKEMETERINLRLQQEQMRLLSDLASGLSHDIKTPLTVILAKTYMLERRLVNPDHKEHLETINKQVSYLQGLVDSLITLFRLDHAPQLNFEAINTEGLLHQVEGTFIPLAETRGVTLQSDIPDMLPKILASEQELQRAFNNLIENAIRYTPSGGSVTLRAFPEPDSLMVEVSDTGIGMTMEDQEHAFDRYYRAPVARERVTGGSGLGLAITKRIIELHAGSLTVQSEVGRGTTFRVSLPT